MSPVTRVRSPGFRHERHAPCHSLPRLTVVILMLVADPASAAWVRNGAATTAGAEVVLTPATGDQVGSAWLDTQIDLSQDFDLSFTLNLGNIDGGGADGISLAFSRDPRGTAALGGTGGGGEWIGMYGITPAVSIEVDTYQNTARGDPANDHLGINEFPSGGAGVPNHAGAAAVDAIAGGANIEDGANHVLRVTWVAATTTMTVRFDGATRITWVRNMTTAIFGGNSQVWMGLVASTGGAMNRQSFIPPTATLTGTKTPVPASVPATTTSVYTIQLSNSSASTAFVSQVTDTLPSGFTYVTGSTTGLTTANPAISGSVLTWNLTAVVPPASSRTLAFTVTAPSTPGSYVNRYGASGSNFTRVSGAGTPLTVRPIADLSLVKSHLGMFAVGSAGSWQLDVANGGPHTAAGPITVTDVLPTGISYSSSSGTGWTVNTSGAPTIVWTHAGSLASGASLPPITVNVLAGAAAVPSVTNSAVVASATDDLVPANNTDTDPTTVLGAASGNKPLYLIASAGLSRAAPASAPAEVTIDGNNIASSWTMTPVSTGSITLTAGTIPVRLYLYRSGPGSSRTITVALSSTGATTGAIGTPVSVTLGSLPTSAASETIVNIPLAAARTLATGSRVVVTVTNTTGAANRRVIVVPKFGAACSRVVLTTSDVISAGTPAFYTAAWPGGTATTAVVPNTTVYLRMTATDPFGAADITAARLDWIRPDATPALNGVSMSAVTSTAGTKTYEYAAAIPPSGAGVWTARVTAVEGSEGTVTDVRQATIVAGVPSIDVTKLAWTVSDPQNGSLNPKAIPGATVAYTIDVRNAGPGPADANSLALVDRIPTGTALRVTDLGGPGSGPVSFTDGVVTSGLTLTFAGLASLVDDIDFSSDGGLSFTYVPTPDGQGRDPAVTHIRVRPQGSFRASTGGGDPGFRLAVRLDVR